MAFQHSSRSAQARARAAAVSDWQVRSARALHPWLALQRGDGSFIDPVTGGTARRYANATLGYALLVQAVRTGDDARFQAAMRAFGWLARQPRTVLLAGRETQSVFELAAAASAYNVARTQYPERPEFQALSAAWGAWLAGFEYTQIDASGEAGNNKQLVEAVGILELLRTRLSSSNPAAILADRTEALRRVRAVLFQGWPKASDRRMGTRGGMRFVIRSDPPAHPLAYHALSTAFYSRALALTSDVTVPVQASRLRRRMVAGIDAIMAPDGDLAYWGRSQEQGWALTLAASAVAVRPPEADASSARYASLAWRALDRFERLYLGGPYGMRLLPAQRGDPLRMPLGSDPYAFTGSYVGLSAIGLEWALADLAKADGSSGPATRMAADVPGQATLEDGEHSFATVRHGDIWFAVAARSARDLRYDFGVVAAKGLDRGLWRELVRPRPARFAKRGLDSAGPVLLRGGRRYYPYATTIDVLGGGRIVMTGGFRDRLGRVVRRRARFTFVPLRRGVALSFSAQKSDRFELSLFMPAGARGRRVAFQVEDGGQRLGITTREPGYGSGLDATMTRRRVRLQASSRVVSVSYRLR